MSTEGGPRERHLHRRSANPELFGKAPPLERDWQEARVGDQAQGDAFLRLFRELVKEAASLRANEESERILDLGSRLDRAYVEAASLGGDYVAPQEGIRRLIDIIMQAVRAGAGKDAKALAELDDEAIARHQHWSLLEQPLVADLMLPESPIPEDELVPTLLSESPEAVEAAIWLFDEEQLAAIVAHARALLGELAARGVDVAAPAGRLAQLERHAAERN